MRACPNLFRVNVGPRAPVTAASHGLAVLGLYLQRARQPLRLETQARGVLVWQLKPETA
jgi:hypothetical protein